MNRVRQFFSALAFRAPAAQPVSAFSLQELESAPLKWLKRLLLVRVGLSSMETLLAEIQRFPMNKLDEARECCWLIATQAAEDGRPFMIVLKPVPKDSVGRIPNFRVYEPSQVDGVFSTLKSAYAETDREVWFCLSIVDDTTLSLGGRYTMSKEYGPEIVEMIWYTSPRLIEEVSLPSFPFPFWRAKRYPGTLGFQTDLLHIPAKYGGKTDESQKKFLREAHWVMGTIRRYWGSIECLCAILYAAGAREVSLEFRVNAGDLAFIDWDTDRDTGPLGGQ